MSYEYLGRLGDQYTGSPPEIGGFDELGPEHLGTTITEG
jgi:hypothetical protein